MLITFSTLIFVLQSYGTGSKIMDHPKLVILLFIRTYVYNLSLFISFKIIED